MTSRNANEREGSKEEKLPRRDWLLLPMLSLLTISLILGLAQLTAQWLFPEVGTEQSRISAPRSPGKRWPCDPKLGVLAEGIRKRVGSIQVQ